MVGIVVTVVVVVLYFISRLLASSICNNSGADKDDCSNGSDNYCWVYCNNNSGRSFNCFNGFSDSIGAVIVVLAADMTTCQQQK